MFELKLFQARYKFGDLVANPDSERGLQGNDEVVVSLHIHLESFGGYFSVQNPRKPEYVSFQGREVGSGLGLPFIPGWFSALGSIIVLQASHDQPS